MNRFRSSLPVAGVAQSSRLGQGRSGPRPWPARVGVGGRVRVLAGAVRAALATRALRSGRAARAVPAAPPRAARPRALQVGTCHTRHTSQRYSTRRKCNSKTGNASQTLYLITGNKSHTVICVVIRLQTTVIWEPMTNLHIYIYIYKYTHIDI